MENVKVKGGLGLTGDGWVGCRQKMSTKLKLGQQKCQCM